MLSNVAGSVASGANASTASNGFVPILTADRKVDQWNVDNLRLDANVLSSTNTDGDIFLAPVSFVAESVVSSTKTATPLRYAQSAQKTQVPL